MPEIPLAPTFTLVIEGQCLHRKLGHFGPTVARNGDQQAAGSALATTFPAGYPHRTANKYQDGIETVRFVYRNLTKYLRFASPLLSPKTKHENSSKQNKAGHLFFEASIASVPRRRLCCRGGTKEPEAVGNLLAVSEPDLPLVAGQQEVETPPDMCL